MRVRAMRLEAQKQTENTSASVRYERIEAMPGAQAAPRMLFQVPAPVQFGGVSVTPQAPVPFSMGSGDVSMEVYGNATGETVTRGRNTSVGGVSTTTLRRTVIDQMIRESGWVENDYQKEIDGKKVYVVVAKAPEGNSVKSKTYYFTESNGQIYRVAATSSGDGTESAEKKSEELIRTLDGAATKPQQAQNK